MKHFRWFLFFFILLFFLVVSCQEEEGKSIVFQFPALSYIGGTEEEFHYTTKDKLKASLFSPRDAQLFLTLDAKAMEKNSQGISYLYNAKDFSLKKGNFYSAVYPYRNNASSKSVALSYDNQKQLRSNDSSHLSDFAYSYASTLVEADSDTTFSFIPLSGFLRVEIEMPFSKGKSVEWKVKGVRLEGSESNLFVFSETLDLSPLKDGGNPSIVKTWCQELSLELEETVSSGNQLVAYFALGEGSLSQLDGERYYSVIVETEEDELCSSPIARGDEIAAGSCYFKSITL